MTRRKAVDAVTVRAEGLTVTVSVLSDGVRPPVVQVESEQRLALTMFWAGRPWSTSRTRTTVRLVEAGEEQEEEVTS